MIKLPTRGGRSAHRFAADLFATNPIKATIAAVAKRAVAGSKVADRLYVAVCEPFCVYRDVIANEMIKARPDISKNLVREALTDIAIANDFLAAGKCDCKCKLI